MEFCKSLSILNGEPNGSFYAAVDRSLIASCISRALSASQIRAGMWKIPFNQSKWKRRRTIFFLPSSPSNSAPSMRRAGRVRSERVSGESRK